MIGLGAAGGADVPLPNPQQPTAVGEGIDPVLLVGQAIREASADEKAKFGKEDEEAERMIERNAPNAKQRRQNAYRPFNHEITPLSAFFVCSF